MNKKLLLALACLALTIEANPFLRVAGSGIASSAAAESTGQLVLSGSDALVLAGSDSLTFESSNALTLVDSGSSLTMAETTSQLIL